MEVRNGSENTCWVSSILWKVERRKERKKEMAEQESS
jgi:hypothetical protein